MTGDTRQVDVTTHHLEMLAPPVRMPTPHATLDVRRLPAPSPEFARFLYATVGAEWYWCGRLAWSRAQWRARFDDPAVQLWVGFARESPVGYFELEAQAEANVELKYFGLLPGHIGQGLGGALLDAAVARAWAWDARRVWVHTCTLDHPSALGMYQSRGFCLFKTETKLTAIPASVHAVRLLAAQGPFFGEDRVSV